MTARIRLDSSAAPTDFPADLVDPEAEDWWTSWWRRAEEADARHCRKHKPDPHIERLWKILADDDIGLDATWRLLNARDAAAQSTIEALMLGLRHGPKGLQEPATQQRLAELTDKQVFAVAGRLRRLHPNIATPWDAAQTRQLFQSWGRDHGRDRPRKP